MPHPIIPVTLRPGDVTCTACGRVLAPREVMELGRRCAECYSAATVGLTGRCPSCDELYGNRHADACVFGQGIVGPITETELRSLWGDR